MRISLGWITGAADVREGPAEARGCDRHRALNDAPLSVPADLALRAVGGPEGAVRALGRPIFAYSNDSRLFPERVIAFCGDAVRLRPTGEREDLDGMAIEPFELHDNLMLAGGIAASGGCLITETAPPTERYTSLRI